MVFWSRILLTLLVFCGLVVTEASAASPDGSAGPYADEVLTFTQGKTSDGTVIDSALSNTISALGVPDDDAVALGIGGTMIVKFEPSKAITSRVQLYELSPGGDLLMERVAVFMSRDGSTWFYAGTENRSGSVDLPEELSCAVYVKLTDTTDVTEAETMSDGYDVDALMADNAGFCEPLSPPSPTPTPAPVPVNPEATPTVTIQPTSTSPASAESPENQTTSTNQMSLAASSISCSVRDFQVQASLMQNNSPISQKLVTFSYAGTHKTATTDGDGKATVTLSYAGAGEVQVEAEGVNSKSFSITQLNCDETGTNTSADSDSETTGRVLSASTERLAATGSSGYIQLFLMIAALTSAVSIGVMRKYHL